MEKSKLKIGLLGGTFNPPHLGHLYIAEKLYEEFSLDKVYFIPVGDPPHKTDKYIASATDRIKMLQIMLSDYHDFEVLTLETERIGYTYTVDTLTQLSKIYDNVSFYYIIGSDTLFNLKTWKNFEVVFKLTSFLCIARPGNTIDEILNEIKFLKREYSATIYLSNYSGPEISSTQIREALETNNNSNLLDKNVMEYIIKNNVFNK